MDFVLLIVLIVLLLGGGGWYGYYRPLPGPTPTYNPNGLVTMVVVCLLIIIMLYFIGGIHLPRYR